MIKKEAKTCWKANYNNEINKMLQGRRDQTTVVLLDESFVIHVGGEFNAYITTLLSVE